MSNLPLRFHSLEFGLRFEMQGSGGCSAERRSLTGKIWLVMFFAIAIEFGRVLPWDVQVDVHPISIVPFFFYFEWCLFLPDRTTECHPQGWRWRKLSSAAPAESRVRGCHWQKRPESLERTELPCAHHGGNVCLGPGCCLSGVCQGRTALHLAANEVSGPSNIMRMLLEARASLMAKDVTGLDPQSSLPTGHSDTWSLHEVYQSTWMWSIAFSKCYCMCCADHAQYHSWFEVEKVVGIHGFDASPVRFNAHDIGLPIKLPRSSGSSAECRFPSGKKRLHFAKGSA